MTNITYRTMAVDGMPPGAEAFVGKSPMRFLDSGISRWRRMHPRSPM